MALFVSVDFIDIHDPQWMNLIELFSSTSVEILVFLEKLMRCIASEMWYIHVIHKINPNDVGHPPDFSTHYTDFLVFAYSVKYLNIYKQDWHQFCIDIHDPLWMNPNSFGEPLDFSLSDTST